VEDLYSVTVTFNGPPHKVATHLFGDRITIIPYELPSPSYPQSADAGSDAPRGTDEIARYFPPGDLGFAIKHRRTENRTLSADMLDPRQFADAPKEFIWHIKLQDIHVAAVLGVRARDQTGEMQPAVVMVCNPASYSKETFYGADYPMLFVRPRFPDWPELLPHRQAFINNMRTMLVCFNIVTEAPVAYDEQPLAASSPAAIRELVTMMIRTIAGDQAGSEFFRNAVNEVYCGELIHLAASAALQWPLNRAICGQLVDASTWAAFEAAIDAHNRGAPGAVASARQNIADLLDIQLTLSPEDLKPMVEYAPAELRPAFETALAFPPMTLFDIIEHFVRINWPRQELGERLASSQANVVEQLVPAVKAWMRPKLGTLSDAQLAALDRVVADLLSTVGAVHSSYGEFEHSLARVRVEAQTFLDNTGLEHVATPPSMFHLIARGCYGSGGLLGLDYVGHGLHRSLVRMSS
jgi:hypothetical protein